MLVVENLTKIYKSKDVECKALNDVSFVLPDKGMIFIIGKSGSGKSTLLNLIGGLDNITSGDIIADGNRFSTFKEEDFDSYRNSYLGFVFQDFCLIDSLTVKENIRMSLMLQDREDDEKIDSLLDIVEMSEFKDRLPKQLSGGQRQRVAIARALIKNPKLILADEPTGNLDSKTSIQVLKTLKDLSKDRLVVIVSHNLKDANEYADRIVELSDGYIIQDVTRNDNYKGDISFEDDDLLVQNGTKLSLEDIENINNLVKTKNIKFVDAKEKFVPTKDIEKESPKIDFVKKKINFKNSLKLAAHFMKKNVISSIVAVLLVSCLVCLFGACQLFVLFDSDNALETVIENSEDTSFVLTKGYMSDDYEPELKTDNMTPITDDDIQKFYDNGYSGKIYKLYNYSYSCNEKLYQIERGIIPDFWNNFGTIYCQETSGLLICDEEFIAKKYGYGEDGGLDVIKGEIDTTSNKIIITDYVADSILYGQPDVYKSYDDIVGHYTHRGTVGAIINTNYKERYGSLLDEFINAMLLPVEERVDKVKEIFETELFEQFKNELTYYLSIGYTVNLDFETYMKTDLTNRIFIAPSYDFYTLTDFKTGEEKTYNWTAGFYIEGFLDSPELNDDEHEIILRDTTYNSVFGTDVHSKDDEGFEVKYIKFEDYYRNKTDDSTPHLSITFKVVDVAEYDFINTTDFLAIQNADLYAYALYFDDVSMVTNAYNTGVSLNYVATASTFKAVTSVIEIVNVFEEFFLIIAIGIIVAAALVLITFSYTNVKSHSYEIGVLRALGGKNINIARSFILQVVVVGLIVCLIASIGIYILTVVVNHTLANSFVELVNSYALRNIEILEFNPVVIIIDILSVIFVTLISAFLPILFMQRIKPINIIKSKNK